MTYCRNPRYVGDTTIEYGYYPQREADIDLKMLNHENEAMVEGVPTRIHFYKDRFYFQGEEKAYEYLPIRWRVYERKEGLLSLISEDALEIDTYYGMESFLSKVFPNKALFLEDSFLEGKEVSCSSRTKFQKFFAPNYQDCVKMLLLDKESRDEPLLVSKYSLPDFPMDYQGKASPMTFWVYDPRDEELAPCCIPLLRPSPLLQSKRRFEMLGIRVCILLKESSLKKGHPISNWDESLSEEFSRLEASWKSRAKFLKEHAQKMDPAFLDKAILETLSLFGEKDHHLIGAYVLYLAFRGYSKISPKTIKTLVESFAPLRNEENREYELGIREEKGIQEILEDFRGRMDSPQDKSLERRLEALLRYLSSMPNRHFHDKREWVKEEESFALEAFTEVLLNA